MSGSLPITASIEEYLIEIKAYFEGNRPTLDTSKLIDKINSIRQIDDFKSIDSGDRLAVFYESCAALKFECKQYINAHTDYMLAAEHCLTEDTTSDKLENLRYAARALIEKYFLDVTKTPITEYEPHLLKIRKLLNAGLNTFEDTQYHGRYHYYYAVFGANKHKFDNAKTHLETSIDYFSRDTEISRIQLCYSQHAMAALCYKSLQTDKALALSAAVDASLTATEKASDAYQSAVTLWQKLTADGELTVDSPSHGK